MMTTSRIIKGAWLLVACMPLCMAWGAESYTSYVPADDGAHHIYSSASPSPVWRLGVGISNSHCKHDVGTQSPNDTTWVLETATPDWCAWKCVVAGTNMTELFFQQTFAGKLVCTNAASGGGGGGGGSSTNETGWSITGSRELYEVIPESVSIVVGQVTNFIAYADGDTAHLINSEWSLAVTNAETAVIPSPLPNGSSVSFKIGKAGEYTLTGRAVGDPDASDSSAVRVIGFKLDMPPYLGVNMIDPTNTPVDSKTATVTLDDGSALPADATFEWSLDDAPHAAFNPAPSGNTAPIKEIGSPSDTNRQEKVKVDISPYGQTLETNFTVVAVDIVMQGRDETNEETTGAFVCYNGDDDNTNGVPDLNESPVTNENDLVELTIKLKPNGLPPAEWVSITTSSGLNLYEDAWKQTNALSSYAVSNFPLRLWAEGASVSTTVRDQFIEAKFDPAPNARDRVNVTIIKVDIAMDGNRDDTIDFDDPEDEEYLFWVNDDHDNEHHNESMWQQDDEDGDADADDDYIGNSEQSGVNGCERDLEDFTRLHLFVDDNATTLPGVTYHLKFENVTAGSPSVNLFEAVDPSSFYLSFESIAASQILKERIHFGAIETIGSTEVELDPSYIVSGNQRSAFLLEGVSEGTGDLAFIVKVNGDEVCKRTVNLELHKMPWFYDVYSVGVNSGTRWEVQIPTNATHSLAASYSPATSEKFLLVHGWNMSENEKTQWIQTTFKRLWWQGYQGSVALFSWPTLAEYGGFWDVITQPQHFNNSEFRAWLSADALIGLFNTLNADGKLRVMAHSMGNVVAGEALRRYAGTQRIHTYIAAQAALSAQYYDNTVAAAHPVSQITYAPPLFFSPLSTPDIYGHYHSGHAPDDPYLADNGNKVTTMLNYFNAEDWALDLWEQNNVMKPANWTPYLFGYVGSETQYQEGTDRFYRGPIADPLQIFSVAVQRERHQIFAYSAESRSKALGQAENGEFAPWNLEIELGYDSEHYSHSREFRSHLPEQWDFWSQLVADCLFGTTIP